LEGLLGRHRAAGQRREAVATVLALVGVREERGALGVAEAAAREGLQFLDVGVLHGYCRYFSGSRYFSPNLLGCAKSALVSSSARSTRAVSPATTSTVAETGSAARRL